MNIKFVFQNEKIRKNAVDTTYMMRIWIITIVGVDVYSDPNMRTINDYEFGVAKYKRLWYTTITT